MDGSVIQRRYWHSLVLALLCSAYAAGIQAAEDEPALRVFASIPPLADFVAEVAGPKVEVDVLLPPGASPATYDPSPVQMARLAGADLLFTVGVPFEKRLLEHIAAGFDNLTVIDTRRGVELLELGHSHSSDHSHGEAADPHIWLDPQRAQIQAATICQALAEVRPDRAEFFRQNLADFRCRLDSIDTLIRQQLAGLTERRIYVFHPAYAYFCDAYGLDQVAVEVDGKEPSAKQMTRFLEQAGDSRVRVLFAQPQFSARMVQMMARELGAEVIALDPLGTDYTSNLVSIARKIARALGGDSEPAVDGSVGTGRGE